MTQNGTVRQRGGYLNKRLYRICDILGIVKKTSHKMRRYYATSLLNEINDEKNRLRSGKRNENGNRILFNVREYKICIR